MDTVTVTAPVTGLVRATLAGDGDWDLAVFDVETGKVVAASAGLRSNEIADGFVAEGQELLIQGCRYGGQARQVRATVDFLPVDPADTTEPVQVVRVNTPTRADKNRLLELGLDITEHATQTTVEVILHGEDDAARLRQARFTWEVQIPDLAARIATNQAADERYQERHTRSALPSGRTSYRRLADYEYEMKELGRRFPHLVRPFVLSERTVEGRDITAIEIALNPGNIHDGKPVFLNMGVHHAREWPSAEHVMEWAYDLVYGYGSDPRTTRLVAETRNIIVPVVNPDGFTISREAVPIGDFSTFDYEMKRKNCQATDSPSQYQGGVCADNPAGRLRGTDLNRNYAGFWGGPGASPIWSSDIYRGSAPFSEPETRAIRDLISTRSVTNLISNHTYGNLVLRPPGVMSVRPPVEEELYEALGARLASHNGYANIPSWGLYDTTGSTEDWSFWNTGGLGFTFEIGPDQFHPPFESGVVNEYLGLGDAAGAGQGGNREAYFAMLEATADSSYHSVITGQAPRDAVLTVSKTFQTPTSPVLNPDGTVGEPLLVTDELRVSHRVSGGQFAFHVNPSTRPYVAGRYGREPQAPPQRPIPLPNPDGQPAENTLANPLEGDYEAIPFTIAGLPEADNGFATIHIEWSNPETDWDLYVVDASGTVVGRSASYGDTDEDAVLVDPVPGEYLAIVVNYDQVDGAPFDDWSGGEVTFSGPEPPLVGVREAWMVTCQRRDGSIAAVHQVIVDRGQTVDLGNACDASRRMAVTEI